ncbi:MKL/myocardin-like protein 1 isoform X1 [Centruroides sculpturatus]|uniref:MKL/myocardin-like protein 1 isoform X1 n=2 Tax=Centruroides sculpturatus TaxID=218467 RepID=UPI000C6EDC3E|nr:MKL/myocardin-like protein 1 isoform X1 [Centruroides sculpturatus]
MLKHYSQKVGVDSSLFVVVAVVVISNIMLDCQSTSDGSKEGDTVGCKHCQGTGDKQVYWGIQLDQDLLETIISIYPEWFKDYTLNHNTMADNIKLSINTANQNTETSIHKPIIPLLKSENNSKAEVDDASLQTSMDKNKESLKVKLLLRRPLNQLVEQGIMPSLKTPPAFHEQRQKLERAKMGDILKSKIQRRPDRQELIQQHILEDTTVDPSLQAKQRQLKKARLADGLNDRLSHRPGPLELIKGNILKTDEEFAQAIREGQINFRRTCEGQAQKHLESIMIDEEDSSSEAALSPPQDTSDISQSSFPSLEPSDLSPGPNHGSPGSFVISFATSPVSSVTSSPVNSLTSSPPPRPISTSLGSPPLTVQTVAVGTGNNQKESNKNRKKSKSKAQPKTRTIKFHEYKGPPNAQKNQTTTTVSSETSYELLLQQQQLLLQWQLEWQQKYPQIILSASQNSSGDQTVSNGQTTNISHSTQNQDILRTLSKLEDMKVSDLKAELKRRNLPVSGSKPQLIERLKPYSDFAANISTSTAGNIVTVSPTMPVNVSGLLLDAYSSVTCQSDSEVPPTSPMTMNNDNTPPGIDIVKQEPFQETQLSGSRPSSVVPMDIDSNPNNDAIDINNTIPVVASNENIVKLQQKRIEELQRELEWSHLQLQQHQSILNHQKAQSSNILASPAAVAVALTSPSSVTNSPSCSIPSTISSAVSQDNSVDSKLFSRQLLQQKFQQNQNSQQGIPIVSTQPSSASVKASLAAFLHNQQNAATSNSVPTSVPLTSFPATLIASHVLATAPTTSSHINQATVPVVLTQPTSTLNINDKSHINSLPNGVLQKSVSCHTPLNSRASSLPNFALLQTTKPCPVRTNTDPKFQNSRLPPNYDEATKQLKSNQAIQQFQLGIAKQLTTKRPRGQKSVKSQAVDDVLEILIKNGELPPSAAQEPPTPTTPETGKPAANAPPLFPSTSSLPSVTPPPSTILTETENGVTNTLDFDFHLGLDEIEAMDLGVLGPEDNSQKTDSSIVCPSTHTETHKSHQQCNKNPSYSISANNELTNTNMDIELCDWLDSVMQPSTNTSVDLSSNGSFLHRPQNTYNNNNDNDPLLSNMASTHDPFDLFSIEDMDFKTPTELSGVLSWDKVDFAT